MFELRPSHGGGRLTRSPFQDMDELERRFFGPAFGSFFRGNDLTEFRTDITDQGDSYLLEADLPGFDKGDIHLDVSGDTLTIEAERHSEHERREKEDSYIRWERSYGKYSRVFDVSEVDTGGIRARYENGVLRLTMPKRHSVMPETRRLEIE